MTGSGGNVRLVKTLDYFKEFLQFAETEYIYVQAGWLEPGQGLDDVVRYMIDGRKSCRCALGEWKYAGAGKSGREHSRGAARRRAEFIEVNGQPVGN